MLEQIKQANDIKKLPEKDLPVLADEIRRFLISSLSRTGGHIASNLGVVELTMALHRVYDPEKDRLIWDVGHQSYTHKILTGRKEAFGTLRKTGGLSGFPKRSESCCDAFDTGHSSSSISAGVGYTKARDLTGADYSVVSIIGDGALTGGMAYEALNNAAELKTNFVVVLNDNEMSIAKNVGGMSTYLSDIRTASAYTGMKMSVTRALEKIPRVGDNMIDAVRRTKSGLKQLIIPGMLFENMGLTYLGPVDGHNISQMIRVFQEAKQFQGPVLVHVLTRKGKGYGPAVHFPERFHGAGPFRIKTGEPLDEAKRSYTDVFSEAMTELGAENPRLCAITAAMPSGVGLKAFEKAYPDRFFDVGIAEEHAVTFAGGLALGGMVPVVAVYSSFLQRAFDQLVQDICMQKLHVVFALDRAGIVGSDGETHHGVFDLSYLSVLPNMTVLAPKNGGELKRMLRWAVEKARGPVAIRYPRGSAWEGCSEYETPLDGKPEQIKEGTSVCLLAVGSMVKTALETAAILERETGHTPAVYNARYIKPIDHKELLKLADNYETIVTMEENVAAGGFGEHVLKVLADAGAARPVLAITLPDRFITHGSVADLYRQEHFDAPQIAEQIINFRNHAAVPDAETPEVPHLE